MVTELSHTRLTLCLDIIRRIDTGVYAGFHELNVVKHLISLHDSISLDNAECMTITCNHPDVPVDQRNVCWKAVTAMQQSLGINRNVSIDIKKNIPVQGGLAGGSANAATVMRLLCRLWNVDVPQEDLCRIGRSVGMDVPSYFVGNTTFDTEAAGIVEPIVTDLRFDFVLYLPAFGVSTRDAYAGIDYSRIGRRRDATTALRNALAAHDRDAVAAAMHNDFELSVFTKYPELISIGDSMRAAGCRAVVLSGSGSTMVGLADNAEHARTIASVLGPRSMVVSSC